MSRLKLPTVTLCAATSVNVAATVAALEATMDQIVFGEVLFVTDGSAASVPPGVRIVPIAPLRSGRDYSEFMLTGLGDHIETPHCLVVQWDGFVLDARRWDDRFLDVDYIGAPWPQFDDDYTVGNGGFSLRSKRLVQACRDPRFRHSHPEDIAIARENRDFLEREHGITFADETMAARFSAERMKAGPPTFGFHGAFNMVPLLGGERFWTLYERLDDRTTVFHDYPLIMRQLGTAPGSAGKRLRLTRDLLKSRLARAAGQA